MQEPPTYDWSSLRHAFGAAEDIPRLLERIGEFPPEPDWEAEPWFSLWSALCHQGEVYTASIYAVPGIVSTLEADASRATMSFYLLPTSIAVADNAQRIEVSPDCRRRYTAALAALGEVAIRALPTIADPDTAIAARAAILVSQGVTDRLNRAIPGSP